MLVYHGSNMEVKLPDIRHSKRFLDFGSGFYITTFFQQAEKWAKRKAMRNGGCAVVNVYEMSDNLVNYHVLNFENADADWLDFVCACRRGENINQVYDIVIGNVANDDVFKSVDMYFRGIWDKERTIKELRYYKQNSQIVLVSQKAINETLQFVKTYVVE